MLAQCWLAGLGLLDLSVGEQGVMPTQTEPPRCSATSSVPVRSLLGLSSLSYTQSWLLLHVIRTLMFGRMFFELQKRALEMEVLKSLSFIFRI